MKTFQIKTCAFYGKSLVFLALSFVLLATQTYADRIHDYAEYGNLIGVERELQAGVNIDEKDNDGFTALIWASWGGRLEVVKYLVSQGATIDAKTNDGDTALIWAKEQNYREVVKFLEKEIALRQQRKDRESLHYYAEYGNLAGVKRALQAGANIDAKNNDGWTALISASYKDHVEVVKYLVSQGANIQVRTNSGNTALMLAKQANRSEIVYFLEKEIERFLHDYARNGNLAGVKRALQAGADIEAKDDDWTALIYASVNGRLEVVKYLVSQGANIDGKDNDDWTALIWASQNGRLEVVKYLASQGAKINAKDDDDWTALMRASQNGHLEVVEYLVSQGTNIDTKNKYGDTALMLAKQKNHNEVVNFLQEKIAFIKQQGAKDRKRYASGLLVLTKTPQKISVGVSAPLPSKDVKATEQITTYAKNLTRVYQETHFSPIPQPELPAPITIQQEQWEINREFRERVQETKKARQKDIDRIQKIYREKVEARNAQISKFNPKPFIVKAVNDVIGHFTLENPKLDQETADMYAVLQSAKSDYQQPIKIKNLKSRELRKAFYQDRDKINVSVHFQVSNANAIELKEISLNYGKSKISASATNQNFEGTRSPLVVNIGSADELQAVSQLQNPNLQIQDDIVIDKHGHEMKLSYNDDIESRVAKLKPASKLNKKVWIFAIGIEKYSETDDIIYAERSAKLLTQTLAKQLGATKGKTILLLNEKATSGAIEDQMKYLNKHVKKGDVIYFYYNGHGLPKGKNQDEAYLLPSDRMPDFIDNHPEFKLDNFYKSLTDTKAEKVVAFVDSCFTGYTDGKPIIKGKAAVFKTPKKVNFDQKKMAILTAGGANQYSSAYWDKGHRLFTYFVIKELLNQKPKTIGELHKRVYGKVYDTTLETGKSNLQQPAMLGNPKLIF